MLVLTRKVDQSILIGTDIKITLIGITGKYAKIGIEAPLTFHIIRLECTDGNSVKPEEVVENKQADTGAISPNSTD